jgi:DNA-binding Lrp family transcriptional regulator
MPKVDDQTYRILSLLRDRPLSWKDLTPLVKEDPPALKQRVAQLARDGLIRPLAASLVQRIVGIGATGQPPQEDEPLTLTFRGMMQLK